MRIYGIPAKEIIHLDYIGMNLVGYNVHFWFLCILLSLFILYQNTSFVRKAFQITIRMIKTIILVIWKLFITLFKKILGNSKVKKVHTKIWDLTKKYFSFYRFKNLKKLKINKLVNIFLFLITLLLLSFLISVTFSLSKDILPQNFDKSMLDNLQLFYILIILFLIVIFSFVSQFMHQISNELVQYILGFTMIYLSTLLKLNYLIIFLFVIGWVLFFMPVVYNYWKKPRWWAIWAVIILLTFYISGLIFIDGIAGNKILDLKLNNCTDTTQRIEGMSLKCSDPKGRFIINNRVECTLTPPLKDISATVSFGYANGSNEGKNINDLKFDVPENLITMYFEIGGIKDDNSPICISSSWDFAPPSLEEYNERKNKFISYFIGLIGVLLFSVPAMMVNIKKILDFDKSKENGGDKKN